MTPGTLTPPSGPKTKLGNRATKLLHFFLLVEEKKKPRVSAKTYEDLDVLRERENSPILVSKKTKI